MRESEKRTAGLTGTITLMHNSRTSSKLLKLLKLLKLRPFQGITTNEQNEPQR